MNQGAGHLHLVQHVGLPVDALTRGCLSGLGAAHPLEGTTAGRCRHSSGGVYVALHLAVV